MRNDAPDMPPKKSENKFSIYGKHWWVLALGALLIGFIGIRISYALRSGNQPEVTSNQIITSTGGVFNKEPGSPAPGWKLSNLQSNSSSISLRQFKGHPLIVNFWASWCPPCRQEMPALASVANMLQGKVAFVGIDTSDQRHLASAFAKKSGVRYPLAFDPSATVFHAYGVYGLPTTYFISSQGTILGRQIGGMTKTRVEQLIRREFSVSIPNKK